MHMKMGIDDYLAQNRAWPREAYEALERIPLTDERFTADHAWYQNWEAKQTEQEALRDRVADEFEVQQVGGLYSVTFRARNVRFLLDRVHDARGGVQAELAAICGEVEVLSGTDISLKSDGSRTKIARTLTQVAPKIPWLVLLSKACAKVVELHRVGEPPVTLTVDTPVEAMAYAVDPVIVRGKVTVAFAEPGVGKSLFGLLVAIASSVGESVAGLSAQKSRPLYLDYEDSADVHARRLKAIAVGHPHLAHAEVQYQFCTQPLFIMGHQLLRRIAQESIDLLIVDSLALACGGDPMAADSALRIFSILRQCKCSVLALAHPPKNTGEGEPSIYGSIFNKALSRSVWELRKEQDVDHDQTRLGLFHRKANHEREHAPMGFLVTHARDGSRIHYATADIGDSPDLAKKLSLTTRLKRALSSGAKTASQLSEELDVDVKNIRPRLNDGLEKWCVKMGKSGSEDRWGLLCR